MTDRSAASPVPGIVMVDDNSLAAAAIERRLVGSLELVWLGWTADPSEAVALVEQRRPGVVLLDVDMPAVDTFSLLRRLVSEFPGTAVLMFSGLDKPELIEDALNQGASGYIHKDEPTSVIVDLIVRASKGDFVLSPLASRAYMRTNGNGVHD